MGIEWEEVRKGRRKNNRGKYTGWEGEEKGRKGEDGRKGRRGELQGETITWGSPSWDSIMALILLAAPTRRVLSRGAFLLPQR